VAEEQTSRILNKEVFALVALAFATFWVFLFTRNMAAREQHLETRIASIWYDQGREYIASGKIDKAIQSFRNATADARDNREYALALAGALAAGHHNAEAQQLLLRLRESDPENAEINTYLARLTSQARDITEAVNYYQNALYGRWNGTQVDQRRRNLRIELIYLLLNHQKHDLAISELLLLEADLPDTVASHLETANLFLKAGDLQQALKNQTAALRLDSHNVEALTAAGETSFQLGDYTKARQYLKAALEAGSTSEATRQHLELTEMVLDDDPLAPRLSANERQNRLLLDLNRSLQQLDACLSQTTNVQAIAELQSLRTEALALEPELNRTQHPADYDTVKSGMGVILCIQNTAARSCGTLSASNEALLLIAREHNGAHQ
jgi:tetratricopeptide (TPR) repeat protein